MKDNNLLSQYKESKRIIRQAMNDNQLVLFVGAGASIASGMPSWSEAIEKIAERLSITDTPLDYLRIPQNYYNARGKKEYTQLMRNIFKHGDFLKPNEIHNKIVEFNAETIITTNYDHLIEQAAEDNSQVISVVSKDADLPYRKAGKELIKMHGDFENDNFVLKEEDYLDYSKNFKLIENYVKSLIGTKVVLFIGYSFNDPDMKLIFSWVKDILGGDFQRAYLIEAVKSYDINEAEYFKNFGINILYASVELSLNPKKGIDPAYNLLSMLKWLLVPDDTNKIDYLLNNLKPFKGMYYASQKYLKGIFGDAGIRLENGVLSIIDTIKEADVDTQLIFNSLAYEQWIRIEKHIELPEELFFTWEDSVKNDEKRIREIQDNNNRWAEEYFKDFKPMKLKQKEISDILDIISKSNILCFECHLVSNKSQTTWNVVRIPIKKSNNPEWMSYVNSFDFGKLEEIANTNRTQLAETRPDLFMEQGYIHFVLGEFLLSYNCYKNAKSIFYKQQKYIQFFIAEFNRYIVGNMISKGLIYGIDSSNAKKVKEECDAIVLDKMFNSLPDLGESNKALKDIYTFNVAYTLFQDAYKTSEKVDEQAKTKYLLFSGTYAFASMRESISDYYDYITLNYLPVNHYSEHVSIFRMYFQSIVNSASIRDDNNVDELYSGKRVHASELVPFDVMVALRFVDTKNIEKLLMGNTITLNMSAVNYLCLVINNYNKRTMSRPLVNEDIFWKCIVILGHCTLSEELVTVAIKKMVSTICTSDYGFQANRIISFLNNANRQKVISADVITNMELLLEGELETLAQNKGEAQFHRDIVYSQLWIMQENGGIFDKPKLITPLLIDDSRLLCAYIYKLLGKKSQKVIYDAYCNWTFEMSDFGFEFYYLLVNSKIIQPNNDAEKSIIEYYGKIKTNEIQAKGIIVVPAQDEDRFLYNLLDLYMKDLIINKDACKKLILEHDLPGVEWLIDYRNYDYDKFDPNWLRLCTKGLITEICREADVRKKIRRAVENQYRKGKVIPEIIDIYFNTLVS